MFILHGATPWHLVCTHSAFGPLTPLTCLLYYIYALPLHHLQEIYRMDCCKICRSIPWSFFNRSKGTFMTLVDSFKTYSHQPGYNALQRSADKGCKFCQLIYHYANQRLLELSFTAQREIRSVKRIVLRPNGLGFLDIDGIDTHWFEVQFGGRFFDSDKLNFELSYTNVPESSQSYVAPPDCY